MIATFKDEKTRRFFEGERVRAYIPFERVAYRKLRQLEISLSLDDLRIPPGNRLEALQGDRKGSFSIRINDQYRVCFRWEDGYAFDVEIVDYH